MSSHSLRPVQIQRSNFYSLLPLDYFLTSLTILLAFFPGPQRFYLWHFSHACASNVSKLVVSDSSPLHYLCSFLSFIFTVLTSVSFWLLFSLQSVKIDRTKLLSLGFSCFMCWRRNSTKLLLVLCFLRHLSPTDLVLFQDYRGGVDSIPPSTSEVLEFGPWFSFLLLQIQRFCPSFLYAFTVCNFVLSCFCT